MLTDLAGRLWWNTGVERLSVLLVRDNPLLAILHLANSRLGDDTNNLGGVSERQRQRYINGGKIPTPPTAKKMGKYIWLRMHAQGAESTREDILKLADEIEPLPNGQDWNETRFTGMMFNLAQRLRSNNGHVTAAVVPVAVNPSPPLGAVNIPKNEPTPGVQFSISKDGSFSISGNSPELLDRLLQCIRRTSNGLPSHPPESTSDSPCNKSKNKKLKGGAS